MTEKVQTEFDAIVIGGGINGLTTAAYLAKLGLAVAMVERRDQLGTHCSTEEFGTPGWRNNPHASGIWVGHSPAMLDLELERFGLDLYFARYARAQPFLDGKALVPDLWDANNFYKKWLKFNEKDAKTFKEIFNRFVDIRQQLMTEFVYSPPSEEKWDATVKLLKSIPHVPDNFLDMTGFEIIDQLFEDEHIKAWLAGWSHAVALEPQVKCVGSIGAIMLVSAFGVQQSIGGSHQVPHALFRCIVHYGGKIFQNCPVEKIIIKDGEAKGVQLAENASYPERILTARKAIVSNLSPVPTFLQLVGEDHLDRSAVRAIKSFNYDWGVLYTAAYLSKEPPHWVGTDFDPELSKAWHFNLGVETLKDVEKCFTQVDDGRIPDPITFLGANFVFSMHDPHSAPPGLHSIQLWPDVPYDIKHDGGPEKWDEVKWDVLEKSTDRLEEYAPGFRKNIVDRVPYSPLDVERRNPSAIKGVWSGGILAPGQFYLDRPFLGCNAPRTPIKKLYLSNGVWPHSFSWLGAGYNAASVVLEDLGLKKPDWWSHKALEWFGPWTSKRGIQVIPKVTI
jgi:phytoene dehydrogenase-like protein